MIITASDEQHGLERVLAYDGTVSPLVVVSPYHDLDPIQKPGTMSRIELQEHDHLKLI